MVEKATTEIHQNLYQDLLDLLNKYAGQLPAPEVLAIASNIVGKLMAYQDQRSMTPAMAIELVRENIELGNRQALEILNETKGNA